MRAQVAREQLPSVAYHGRAGRLRTTGAGACDAFNLPCDSQARQCRALHQPNRTAPHTRARLFVRSVGGSHQLTASDNCDATSMEESDPRRSPLSVIAGERIAVLQCREPFAAYSVGRGSTFARAALARRGSLACAQSAVQCLACACCVARRGVGGTICFQLLRPLLTCVLSLRPTHTHSTQHARSFAR